ncbi:transglycosylase domain-containing protein [Ruminococcus sp. 5_1_39BFAA]|uniref:transglycosylase domain-containing protein n=1 Tax=Ruminococcus sp. 5_1_39BFAA TaxID=457412 RepID=UPI003565B6AF
MKQIKKAVFLLLVIFLLAGGILVGSGYKMYRDALDQKSLAERISEVQANPGYTPVSDLPQTYLDAVIAVEDHRFYKHHGIDLLAIGRAAWNDLNSLSLKEGGSTITQQLAKNLYFTQEKKLTRKIAEVFMAFKLEADYDKEEILEFYVNSIYFGDGYYCVKDACKGYFGKDPVQMTAYEATLLAGIPNAPSIYSPTQNPDLAARRQQYVLLQMYKYGYLNKAECAAILENEI